MGRHCRVHGYVCQLRGLAMGRRGCTLGWPGGAAFWLVVGHSLQEKAWTMAMGSQVQHWSIDWCMGWWEGMLWSFLWARWAFFARLSCASTGLDNASRTPMGSPTAHPTALMLRLTMANWDALPWSSKGACWHVQVCKWVCQMWPMSSPC